MIKWKKVWRFIGEVLSLSDKHPRVKARIKRQNQKKNQISGFVFPSACKVRGKPVPLSIRKKITTHAEYDAFLKKELKAFAEPKLMAYSKKLGFADIVLEIKQVKSMWGRCTRDNRILLNRDLVHVEQDIVEYVIVHEVAHLQEKHHQKAFWDLVAKLMPEYQESKKKLKNLIPQSRLG